MIPILLSAHPSCAAYMAGFDGVRTWATPDDPGRCAITYGGTEAEAHAAVVEALHEVFVGDWTYEARLQVPDCEPCAWCKAHQRYSH